MTDAATDGAWAGADDQVCSVLLVPGRGTVLPEYWLSRWAGEHPDYRWARHRNNDRFDLDDRLAHTGPVRGALATPPTSTGGVAPIPGHGSPCSAPACRFRRSWWPAATTR